MVNEYPEEKVRHVDLDQNRGLFHKVSRRTEFQRIFHFQTLRTVPYGLQQQKQYTIQHNPQVLHLLIKGRQKQDTQRSEDYPFVFEQLMCAAACIRKGEFYFYFG